MKNKKGSSAATGKIGPHEGQELTLMLTKEKPLAMFTEIWPLESSIPEQEFSEHVKRGGIIMREVFEPALSPPRDAPQAKVRRVLYALPTEAWRIDAMVMLCQVYHGRGWDAGLERLTGRLLGYKDEDIEAFVSRKG